MTDLRPAPVRATTPGLTPPTERGFSARLIGDVAVELGYVSRPLVEAAVQEAKASRRTTGRVLLDSGALSPAQLSRVLAERFGLDHVDLEVFPVDSGAARLVGHDVLRRHKAVPVGFLDERTLLVAMAEPSNVLATDDLAVLTGYSVRTAIADPEAIEALLRDLERGVLPGEHAAAGRVSVVEQDAAELRRDPADAQVVRLVHSILDEAIERGASDIHFTPSEGVLAGQLRIDGVLEPTTSVPAAMAGALVSRIKIMAGLDIAERRAPQDGRMTVSVDGGRVDLRVVTLPLVGGETVVLRILDRRGGALGLDRLGLDGDGRARLERACNGSPGAVLVTGPTGSGKTTTLYAALALLNTGGRSILTIEDPVEARMDGIKQMQVDEKAGVSFAAGLRSMLRADPDIVMVGEMRDREAAQLGIEAALTGHVVLSTLHTNDAPSAIARLLEMGIAPFLVADALRCVVGQRLARKLCAACREPVVIAAGALRDAGFPAGGDLPGFVAGGCGLCHDSGYRGRVGIFEVMDVGPHLHGLVMGRASGHEIGDAARAAGMTTLREDALEKVRAGLTSMAEVTRVLGRG